MARAAATATAPTDRFYAPPGFGERGEGRGSRCRHRRFAAWGGEEDRDGDEEEEGEVAHGGLSDEDEPASRDDGNGAGQRPAQPFSQRGMEQ